LAETETDGRTSHAILRGLGDLNIIGADVDEVAPAYDHADITAIAAATIAHDYLLLMAQKKAQDFERNMLSLTNA
jgi:agmatinase